MNETVPAPKRRQRRKDARPAELIEAGLREFAEKGFAGTRLEDVARRAGVSKATIYLYFADKEALFLAAVRSRVAPVLLQVEDAVDHFPGSTRMLLELLLRTVYAQLVDSDLRGLMRIIVSEGRHFPQLIEHHHRESITIGRRLLAKIIERGVARGEFRPGPVTKVPLVVVAPAITASLWKITFDHLDPLPMDDYIEAHVDLIMNGLLTRDGG